MSAHFTLRAATAADLDTVRTMFREYESWLDHDLCFQGFEAELAGLPGRYAPPAGGLWLAEADGAVLGVIALREISPGVCEMKRLYVRAAARGLGVGRALAARVIDEARARGYRAMRLDTLRIEKMRAANALYDALDFRDIPPYYANPLPDVRYMELALAAAPGAAR